MTDYDILLRTMPTPNPLAFKFIANATFKSVGKATFNSKEDAKEIPMVESLFTLKNTSQVHMFDNVVTVTFKSDEEMGEDIDTVLNILETMLPTHNVNFMLPEERREKERKANLSPEMKEIEEILDRTIRPGLQADGGDLEILSYEDKVLTISYMGACGTCPSSMYGTLDAIQSILQNEYDDDLQVSIY